MGGADVIEMLTLAAFLIAIAAAVTGLACAMHRWARQNAEATADLDVWRAVADRLQGCVCPAGSELSCRGKDCPRRTALADPVPWPFDAK
jgi:hypothetical protein